MKSAYDTFNAAAKLAQSAYITDLIAAGSTFQTDLTNYTGNSSYFALSGTNNGNDPALQGVQFNLPGASQTLPIGNSPFTPTASNQANVPGRRLTYSGYTYDFSKAPQYTEAIKAAKAKYDKSINAAETALDAARLAANNVYKAEAKTAEDALTQAKKDARGNLQNCVDCRNISG